MQALQPDYILQSGKYIIKKVLGQGGFGITYLAENTMLEGKVAIKEFFFKEYCERDDASSHVTIGTSGNRELVERFKQKFIKEARTIFSLNHPNIVRILDLFEENGTAYYVMDYIEGESLGDMVKRRGAIPEAEAIGYIKEVASALSYIHGEKINHLDVKPSNIMKRQEDGRILLIDFGVSKQYDAETAEGTTTTPVGISYGYSPAEQYEKNGVSSFSPQSDIYSLGATLYKLITGVTPPEAIEVAQKNGLLMDAAISGNTKNAIVKALQFRKDDRPQTISDFLAIIDAQNNSSSKTEVNEEENETTRIIEEPVSALSTPNNNPTPVLSETKKKSWLFRILVLYWPCLVIVFIVVSVIRRNYNVDEHLDQNPVNFKCTICNSDFVSQPELNEHIEYFHASKDCPYCAQKYEDNNALKNHIIKAHHNYE